MHFPVSILLELALVVFESLSVKTVVCIIESLPLFRLLSLTSTQHCPECCGGRGSTNRSTSGANVADVVLRETSRLCARSAGPKPNRLRSSPPVENATKLGTARPSASVRPGVKVTRSSARPSIPLCLPHKIMKSVDRFVLIVLFVCVCQNVMTTFFHELSVALHVI